MVPCKGVFFTCNENARPPSFDGKECPWEALYSNETGVANTAIGETALFSNTTGWNNAALGTSAGGYVTTANNVICIGAGVYGANVSNSCYIGNIWNQPGGSQAVYVNSEGKLGFQVSFTAFQGRNPTDGECERSNLWPQTREI